MKDIVDRLSTSIRNSRGLRLLGIAILALLLQIPVLMISGLVSEREERRASAVTEVSSKWGNAQAITGPALVLPYTYRWSEVSNRGTTVARSETRYAFFLPETLHVRGDMKAETRHRGIFSVPVYKLALTVDGDFARPKLAELGVKPEDVDWRRAHVAVGISDVRAIQEGTSVTWNGQPAGFLPGTGGFTEGGTGIHAPVTMADTTQRMRFAFPLSLNGSESVRVAPFGQTTVVELHGNSGDPSFQGNWLPTTRNITDNSFDATWNISFLGRSFPQSWTSDTKVDKDEGSRFESSRFGVALVDPVGHYAMAHRSVKYAGLFIMLTFATVWLIEILAGVRVHAIQYLMIGGALCLFYLLELSLSEHLGFPAAYVIASAAVVAMLGAYGIVALRRASRAGVVAAGVALLYAYLYLLLMNEDYALLIGSIGLFAILGAIMYVTRRIDWYAASDGPSPAGQNA